MQRISLGTMAKVFRHLKNGEELPEVQIENSPICMNIDWTFERFLNTNKRNFQYYEDC